MDLPDQKTHLGIEQMPDVEINALTALLSGPEAVWKEGCGETCDDVFENQTRGKSRGIMGPVSKGEGVLSEFTEFVDDRSKIKRQGIMRVGHGVDFLLVTSGGWESLFIEQAFEEGC
jgi:hypothetical protein